MKTRFQLPLFVTALVISIGMTSCGEDQAKEENTQSKKEQSVEKEEKKDEPAKKKPKSPRKMAEGSIGSVKIVIDYGSPSVRGREIWGGLEMYDKVWRAGANETTSISFDQNVTINGNAVAAGKYGFFIIPREHEDWTIILNEDWSRDEHGAWGSYNYDESKDVARVDVAPEWDENLQEELEYEVTEMGVSFSWEKVRLGLTVEAAL